MNVVLQMKKAKETSAGSKRSREQKSPQHKMLIGENYSTKIERAKNENKEIQGNSSLTTVTSTTTESSATAMPASAQAPQQTVDSAVQVTLVEQKDEKVPDVSHERKQLPPR